MTDPYKYLDKYIGRKYTGDDSLYWVEYEPTKYDYDGIVCRAQFRVEDGIIVDINAQKFLDLTSGHGRPVTRDRAFTKEDCLALCEKFDEISQEITAEQREAIVAENKRIAKLEAEECARKEKIRLSVERALQKRDWDRVFRVLDRAKEKYIPDARIVFKDFTIKGRAPAGLKKFLDKVIERIDPETNWCLKKFGCASREYEVENFPALLYRYGSEKTCCKYAPTIVRSLYSDGTFDEGFIYWIAGRRSGGVLSALFRSYENLVGANYSKTEFRYMFEAIVKPIATYEKGRAIPLSPARRDAAVASLLSAAPVGFLDDGQPGDTVRDLAKKYGVDVTGVATKSK